MRSIVAWLVAKPQNAILGLAGTLIIAHFASGAVMALLVLHHGPVRSVISAFAAGTLLAAIALIVDGSAVQVLANGLIAWVPMLVLASLLRYWRSVTFTMQISVVVALLGLLLFYAVVADPIAYWKSALTEMAPQFASVGLQQQADVLLTQQDVIAPQMTILVAFTGWSITMGALLLGYALLQMLPEQSRRFGRFCDLNFGRLLAIVTAVVSVGAAVSSVAWLQSAAFLMLAVFWLQGLAIAHWLHAEDRLPVMMLVLVYVMLPVLNLLLVLGLAVAGYLDAWFGLRRRAVLED